MSENSKNEVEFLRNMYFLDLILAREARHEKLYNESKANKTHCRREPLAGKPKLSQNTELDELILSS